MGYWFYKLCEEFNYAYCRRATGQWPVASGHPQSNGQDQEEGLLEQLLWWLNKVFFC